MDFRKALREGFVGFMSVSFPPEIRIGNTTLSMNFRHTTAFWAFQFLPLPPKDHDFEGIEFQEVLLPSFHHFPSNLHKTVALCEKKAGS
jgi:hypothetical protein